jgi:hypothetical protein
MEIKHAYYSIKQTSDQRILKNSNEFKVFWDKQKMEIKHTKTYGIWQKQF